MRALLSDLLLGVPLAIAAILLLLGKPILAWLAGAFSFGVAGAYARHAETKEKAHDTS